MNLFYLLLQVQQINEITVTNAAASGDPAISATGSDTNIDLNLVAKGTGVVQSNGSALAVTGKQTIWVPATAMYRNNYKRMCGHRSNRINSWSART